MSDMIERVAKAICKSKSFEGFMCCQHPANLGRTQCPVKDGGYQDAAMAAIEAMREPNNRMLHAAAKSMSPERRPTPKRVGVKEKHRIRYRAMIDAVLGQSAVQS